MAAESDVTRASDASASVPSAPPGGSAKEILPLVYAQLHAAARKLMSNERRDHTLQATALVSEAYTNLARDPAVRWPGPREFYLAAAEAMRRILIDHARRRSAAKRGGGHRRALEIGGLVDLAHEDSIEEVMALDEAVLRLQEDDARAAEVVRLRFFAGLTGERVADLLDVSARQVDRDWAYARAFLLRELRAGDGRASNSPTP